MSRAQQSVQLVVLSGAGVGRRKTITGTVVIGRGEEVDLRLDESRVSRCHAAIRILEDGQHIIEDLGSRNGTKVDGIPVLQQMPLSAGNVISLGDSTDILFTRRDPSKEELRARLRLETLGRLTSGIVHDSRSTLAVIKASLAQLQLLLDKRLGRDEAVAGCLQDIGLATSHIDTLIAQLRSLARGDTEDHTKVDVSALCGEVVRLVRRIFPPEIQLISDIEPELQVAGDAGQLYQIVLNLCLNAQEAMPDGGQLHLEARRRDRSELLRQPPGQHARFVDLRVSDTGVGMAAEVVEQIFDPFFSTRSGERGFGLGLDILLKVIEQHSGCVHVASEPGKGTTFHVYLPRLARRPRVTETSIKPGSTTTSG